MARRPTYLGLQVLRVMAAVLVLITHSPMVLAGEFVLHARFSPFDTAMSYLFLPTRNSDGEFFPLLGAGWTLNFDRCDESQ